MTPGYPMTTFLDRRDSEHRDGIDILRFKLDLEGIETNAHHLAEGHTMLVRSVGDGTSFIVTGRGRQNYSIGRYADEDDMSPPTHFGEHMTSETVVDILTLVCELPEYDSTAWARGMTLPTWYQTAGARLA